MAYQCTSIPRRKELDAALDKMFACNNSLFIRSRGGKARKYFPYDASGAGVE